MKPLFLLLSLIVIQGTVYADRRDSEGPKKAHLNRRVCGDNKPYLCADRRQCITRDLICDGLKDCWDGSDEVRCKKPKTKAYKKISVCGKKQPYRCVDKSFCIYSYEICDGFADCKDGTDEIGCGTDSARYDPWCDETYKGEFPYVCADMQNCLARRHICDGRAQCRDESDEVGCDRKEENSDNDDDDGEENETTGEKSKKKGGKKKKNKGKKKKAKKNKGNDDDTDENNKSDDVNDNGGNVDDVTGNGGNVDDVTNNGDDDDNNNNNNNNNNDNIDRTDGNIDEGNNNEDGNNNKNDDITDNDSNDGDVTNNGNDDDVNNNNGNDAGSDNTVVSDVDNHSNNNNDGDDNDDDVQDNDDVIDNDDDDNNDIGKGNYQGNVDENVVNIEDGQLISDDGNTAGDASHDDSGIKYLEGGLIHDNQCASHYPSSPLMCSDRSGHCLKMEEKCDGWKTCDNGADELRRECGWGQVDIHGCKKPIQIGNKGIEDLKHQIWEAHNYFRCLHGVPPLEWDRGLEDESTVIAYRSAIMGGIVHTKQPVYGENIDVKELISADKQTGFGYVSHWYREVALYDFDSPKINGPTGHFTALIWKNTVKMGCGFAASDDGYYYNMYVAACSYEPKGNIMSQEAFRNNVPRPL